MRAGLSGMGAEWDVGASDGPKRKPVIEGQRTIRGCHKHQRQSDNAGFGVANGFQYRVIVHMPERMR